MAIVPAGEFLMGSPANDPERLDREGPVVRVSVPGPLAVGTHEVTVAEYERFVTDSGRSGGGPCWTTENGDYEERPGRSWRNPGYAQTGAHPVVCVSWEEAQAYVSWLSGKTGKPYRLPSESEWEYAAGAGSTTWRHWGDGEDGQCGYANGADRPNLGYGVFCDDGHAKTSPAGSYRPNGFGLHDTLGNAMEWTEDCWNENHAGAPSDGSARQSGNCSMRAVRGGSWGHPPHRLRTAYRDAWDVGIRNFLIGFRVVREMDR